MEQSDAGPRIYRDEEIQDALQELFSHQRLVEGMKAFLPNELSTLILKEKDEVHSIHEFQKRIILPVMKAIERASITELSASGLESLDPKQRYLFISNHRDIILDSAFLNTLLFEHGFETGQIAIGDNLMKHRISELIFRINKSFVVKRSGSPIELYRYSVLLSEYIRDTILEDKGSVWIAQREGRAKDGNDRTQTGLLKMLSLGCHTDLKSYLRDLHIVPVSISYEFDPCGLPKAREYQKKQVDPNYKKTFQEDVEHMLLGLRGAKGRVHFHYGKPLNEELDQLDTAQNSKKQLELLAGLLDDSIHQHYCLRSVNYLAYDLLHEQTAFTNHYTEQERNELGAFFEQQFQQLEPGDEGQGRKYLLGMYANPLSNYLALKNRLKTPDE
jgi:hypothetical protein